MKHIANLPNGCALFVKEDSVGGREYFSDEIGGGVFVWSTSLVDESTLLAALTAESRIRYAEAHGLKGEDAYPSP